MKSFGFYFRNEYGNNTLEYPVFTDSDAKLRDR